MKDLVVTSLDRFGWKELEVWARSLRASGYNGDALAIVYRFTDPQLVEQANKYNINLIHAELGYDSNPINHQEQPQHASMVCRNRFFHLWWYLQDKTNIYRWVVSTDARDVVFQDNPHRKLDTYQSYYDDENVWVLASSEGQVYEKEPWNAEDQSNTFGPIVWNLLMKNQLVKNAGVMTIKGSRAADVFLNIYFMSKHYSGAAGDQAAYNLLLASTLKNHVVTLHFNDAWVCQCGTILDPTKPSHQSTFMETGVPRMQFDGTFITHDGRPFTIVHQYDRVPEAKQLIERKYRT